MVFSLKFLVGLLVLVACVSAVPNGRVVGGVDANIGQFPHQVSVQRPDGLHVCGGAILNEKYVLTAAHCVIYPPHYYQVRAGSIQRTAGGKLFKLKRIISNKNYGNLLNDIALLELQEPLVWTDNIKPIEMADIEVPSGEDVIVSGWGRLYTDGPNPHRLQSTTLKALTTAECRADIDWIIDSVICLAHEQDNGICFGDSGGPATYEGKLVGVASFVLNGCGSKTPDGYTKVYFHREWIDENMKP